MTTKTLRTICEGLNAEPFSQNLTLIKLDSQTPEKLLQNLSDVVSWIQGAEQVDIRSENPDETAIRILNALRIFKYPPPRDMDQIQKWRLDILEGQKSAIYPVLEWIFDNISRLKERVYLATYLTKIDVPPDMQSQDVTRLENAVHEKMEEFKSIHSRIVESRGDFVRAEDVRSDLKAMEDEKDQLMRKIDRNRRKLARCPDLEKHLEVAARLHAETERQQELNLQRQEQHNALIHAGQRLTRLERILGDVEREKNMADPESIITKLKREVEVNGYVVNEKLVASISTQKSNIEAVQKILSLRNVSKDDIARLQHKIAQLNAEIGDTVINRDKKDDANEDKLGIYRHQSANIQRKKANVADSLQLTKQELENVESILSAKRREISEKSGKDEIVSSVQYKLYVKKLRNKSNFYKRKKAELEQAKAEIQILERTVELLDQRFEELKQECKSEGKNIIEKLDDDIEHQKRPQTSKPSTTNVTELTQMAEELNSNLSQKRSAIQRLSDEIDKFYQAHKEQNEKVYIKQDNAKALKTRIESERKHLEKEVADLDALLKKKQSKLTKSKDNLSKLEWFVVNLASTNQSDRALKNLEHENTHCSKAISELMKELEKISQDGDASNQLAMWNNLVKIFRMKINLQHQKNEGDKPVGDGVIY